MFSFSYVDSDKADTLFEKLRPETRGWMWKIPFVLLYPTL